MFNKLPHAAADGPAHFIKDTVPFFSLFFSGQDRTAGMRVLDLQTDTKQINIGKKHEGDNIKM